MSFVIENDVLKKYEEEPGVTEIVIPDSVTVIDSGAFRWCTGLRSVTLPNGIKEIRDWAFDGCTGLTGMMLPDGIKRIGIGVFTGCMGLTTMTIPGSVKKIEAGVFYRCKGLTSVTIQEGVTEIGRSAFFGCTELSSVTIPDSVTKILHWTFMGCEKLTIALPDTVREVGQRAFLECQKVIWMGFALNEDPSGKVSLQEMLAMAQEKDYTVKMKGSIKYPILWQVFCQNPDETELFAFVKRNFSRMFRFALEQNNVDVVEAVCRQGKLLTKRNIDKFLEYAIEHKQTEIQIMLINYKNEKIGFGKNPFQL